LLLNIIMDATPKPGHDLEKQQKLNPLNEQSPERDATSLSSNADTLVPERSGAFGGEKGGKNYRVLGRWKATLIFINNEVGIGVLSLPAALDTLGLIPGLICEFPFPPEIP
jgi:hypothetical protein